MGWLRWAWAGLVLAGLVGPAWGTSSRVEWLAPPGGSQNSLGEVVCRSDGGTFVVAKPTVGAGSENLTFVSDDGAAKRTLTWRRGSDLVRMTLTTATEGSRTTFTLDAEGPGFTTVDLGAPVSGSPPLAIAYYTGTCLWAAPLDAFIGWWWNWKTTEASRLDGPKVSYLPRTDQTLNPLHEELVVAVSPTLADTLPSPDNPPSPWRTTLAGRPVVDVWSGTFGEIAGQLDRLAASGLRGGVVIVHNWQHQGYDNGLPEHWPANPKLGGDEGLVAVVEAGRRAGHLTALHENYVDYYPNFPAFDPRDIALQPGGGRLLAWFNKTTGIRAFGTKPSRMVPLATAVAPEIRRRYGTDAVFIDVNSSTAISNHGDYDATVPGAGRLRLWTESNRGLWAYQREAHGGPCLGEGLNHWTYSGLLDGVEAQTGNGTNVGPNQGDQLPLFVDFDLLRIHPLQVNHGMGYYERWLKPGTSIHEVATLDTYRLQELAFGHAPFLSRELWTEPWAASLEFRLVGPVAARYGTATAKTIEYRVSDRWVSTEDAARARRFDGVRTTWSNGLVVTANAGTSPLTQAGVTIPPWGWTARGVDIDAGTALRNGRLVDWSDTPDEVFADARSRSLVTLNSALVARPRLASLEARGNRQLALILDWNLVRSIPADVRVLVHFVPTTGPATIAFQGDHRLTDGPVLITVPQSVADGRYSVRVGLYDSVRRLAVAGRDDGSRRVILGELELEGGASRLVFRPEPQPEDRLNPDAVADFGDLRTDGTVTVVRQGDSWVLYPVPTGRDFHVELSSRRFGHPASVVPVRDGVAGAPVPTRGDDAWWTVEGLGRGDSWLWPSR